MSHNLVVLIVIITFV